MKQRGKSWITHEGRPTEAKYLPPYMRLQEELGQKIAAEAVSLHKKMVAAKQMFLDTVRKVYRNTPGTAETRTRFSFTTFDKEYRIEWDMRDDHVRVYQATRKNPTQKDYQFLDLNLASIKPLLLQQIEAQEATAPLPGDHTITLAQPHSNQPDFEEEEQLTELQPDQREIEEENSRVDILTGDIHAKDDVYEQNLKGIDQERSSVYDTNRPAANNGHVFPQSSDVDLPRTNDDQGGS